MKKISILYDDGQFIIFNKPSGVLVTPAPGKTQNFLTRIVNEQYPHEGLALHPCHRLDQSTSGVIVYAKGKKNQQLMMQLFQQGRVHKTYLAFVKGRLKQRSGTLAEKVQDYHQKKFSDKSRAKPASTRFQVMTYGKGFTIVKVVPETGRTNQIRIHFAHIGHPLLGERIYAMRRDFDIDMKRLALHAMHVSFNHPLTGKEVSVEAELPEDMKGFLKGSGIDISFVNKFI
ncbi:MAG: RluA family pseudouridine synthase [Candidatus Omnitrophota bacterium]